MQKKKILLCVSGGIAVYKAVALVSKLSQAGFEVKVIMTASARQFVNPLSFQVMSKNDVFYDTFDEKDSSVIAHIDLADWADLILVAPATANVIGKLANGIADDMVTTTLLATTAPVWIAPAMNVHMYDHPAVLRNIAQLAKDGVQFIEPSEGFLACGYVGKGRLEEPEKITELVSQFFYPVEPVAPKPLQGKKVVITAGPTSEKISDTQVITTETTGEIGYAIAEEAHKLGAKVTVITGPVILQAAQGIDVVQVESAQEMVQQLAQHLEDTAFIFHTAATPQYVVKTSNSELASVAQTLILEQAEDFAEQLAAIKKQQILIEVSAQIKTLPEIEQKLATTELNYFVGKASLQGEEIAHWQMASKQAATKQLAAMNDRQLAQAVLGAVIESEQSL